MKRIVSGKLFCFGDKVRWWWCEKKTKWSWKNIKTEIVDQMNKCDRWKHSAVSWFTALTINLINTNMYSTSGDPVNEVWWTPVNTENRLTFTVIKHWRFMFVTHEPPLTSLISVTSLTTLESQMSWTSLRSLTPVTSPISVTSLTSVTFLTSLTNLISTLKSHISNNYNISNNGPLSNISPISNTS